MTREPTSFKNPAALVLAAGAATRWQNGPKALADWHGRTLLDLACATAREAGCAPILRVLGAHREEIEAHPRPDEVRSVFNPRWSEGLGSSLAHGVRALADDAAATGCPGLVVMLCDQPLIGPATLRALLAAAFPAAGGARGLVFADHGGGRLGPPAFFAREFWPELMALGGDEGARRLARAHPEALATVAAPEAGEDIDTFDDYRRLLARPA